MTTNFRDYMPRRGEYLRPTEIAIDVARPGNGWLVDYIANTFLDGWINYLEPVSIIGVARYGELEKLRAKVETLPDYHTKLSALGDDVAILAHPEEISENVDGREWWYLYFDCDTSDCSIGRFLSTDPDEEVRASFRAYVEGMRHNGLVDIDPEKLGGWVSW